MKVLNDKELKTLIDRPLTNSVQVLDKMIIELSPYLHPIEVDVLVDFLIKIEGSKFDINPSLQDCINTIQDLIGEHRYHQVKQKWTQGNKKLMTVFGTKKFRHKTTKITYDGLDPEDNPKDYEEIYV